MKWLVLCVIVVLAACSDGRTAASRVASDLPPLEDVVQAKAWMDKMNDHPQAQTKGEVPTSGNQGLLTLAVPEPVNKTFTGQKLDTTNKQATDKTGGGAGGESAKVQMQGNGSSGLLNGFEGLNPQKPSAYTARPKALDLSQVGLTDFNYTGALSQNGDTQGFIKVGDRLYKVRVGDEIGRGRWRVLAVDAQKMQLQVAGRTVNYERN